MALTCFNTDAQATEEKMGVSVSSSEDSTLPMVGTYAFALRRQRAIHSRPRGVGDEAAAVKELLQMKQADEKCWLPVSRPRRAMSLKPRARVLSEEAPSMVPTPPAEPRTAVYVRTRFRGMQELHPQKVEGENVSTCAVERPESRCSNTRLCEGATDDSCVW